MPAFPLTSNRKGRRNSDKVAHYMQGPVFSCSLEMIPLVRDFNRNLEANTLPCLLGAVYTESHCLPRVPRHSLYRGIQHAQTAAALEVPSSSQGMSTLETSCGLSSQENKHFLLARLSGKIDGGMPCGGKTELPGDHALRRDRSVQNSESESAGRGHTTERGPICLVTQSLQRSEARPQDARPHPTVII